MVEADFSGSYLSVENTSDNGILEITDEGAYEDKEFNGKKTRILNIPVSNGGKSYLYSPSRDSGRRFVAAWGKETKNWKGKKFQIKHAVVKIYGNSKKVIEGFPLEASKPI